MPVSQPSGLKKGNPASTWNPKGAPVSTSIADRSGAAAPSTIRSEFE